ncbi:hypothetical protein QO004_005027 [Rhizobium mesoamericanum]|uniref:prevent-host-death family protein n=1 Tax=Rhizobium mesoamericanum TaxID=1079800 RepID=UPI0027897BFD|nr:prevent-host-death family protein [Rhizobium mesoamericanum]MDQ0563218.1 hypothetical protein [Rhizobium mesoamericanum]
MKSIDLAQRDDAVVIYSNGHRVAVIAAIAKRGQGTIYAIFPLAAEGRRSGQISNHDDLYDESGLPK